MNTDKTLRALLIIGILAASGPFRLGAQMEPAFTAVSIKANVTPPGYSGAHEITAGRVHFVHVALQRLILDAFRIKAYQLFSSTSLTTGRWDVEATMPPDSSQEQVALMLQTMLKDRFGLQTHFEKRTMPAYVLTSVDRNKLQPATDPSGRLVLEAGTSSSFRIHGRGKMSDLAAFLADEQLNRPVLDKTGLDGMYQINIEYSRDINLENGVGQGDLSAPSLFTVLEDKLGLKLEPRKEEIECVVVDHVALTASPN